ncbi:MAG TPA: response regulator [Caulobacteraceae bacterium]|nr:response regulator [Caulobacteraceae bacterium]
MAAKDDDAPMNFTPDLRRVLIVDAHPTAARQLADTVRQLGGGQVRCELNTKAAIIAAREEDPQVIFTEFAGPHWDGLQFVRTVRRSDLSCRKAPVIMVTAEITAHAILGARDAGVHEYVRKPYTAKDLARRVEAVTLGTRDWIEAVGYVGPDRRRFNSAEYMGPRKRRSDMKPTPNSDKLDQALRIVRSALAALETDPKQAHRSLEAQVVDLTTLAISVGDNKLARAAAKLQLGLTDCEQQGALDRDSLEAAARPLLEYLPASWAA